MKIGIIGTGAYSVAIASMLNKKNKDIVMWTESKDKYDKYLKDGCIKDVIENYTLPQNIKLTLDYKEASFDKDIIFIISSTAFVLDICKQINKYITKDTIVCIASKGIEAKSCDFLSDIAYLNLKTRKIAVISGPSFAIDMVNNNPVGLSIASKSKMTRKVIIDTLSNDTLKLRETSDLIGIQLCGSIKNVIALAAGILNGLGYPESTQCFLITESLHDIKALIKELGGSPKTILSFAGVGDLLLTCTSTKSRNFSYGVLLGSKSSKEVLNEYLSSTTVEGYNTLKSIYKLVKRESIKIPIIDLIYKIVMNGENPELLVKFLINKK